MRDLALGIDVGTSGVRAAALRRRPSSVDWSAYLLSKVATSASTACARSARAPSRNTSVSGSIKLPGWESWKTLVSVTAYHSFAGEVEALNTPTIRRLTPSRGIVVADSTLCFWKQGLL